MRCLLITAVFLLLATVLDVPAGHFISRRGPGNEVLSASRLWLLASSFGFLAVLSVEVLGWVSRLGMYALPSVRRASFDPARRTFLRYAAVLAGGIPFMATAYGFASERLRYRIVNVEVPIANLPKRLEGLRIVQLSDIHIGDFMPRAEVRRAVEMANELNADLAVVTGDFISSAGDPLEDCISELSRLRVPLGIWGCNGNHEVYAEMEDLSHKLFNDHGMRLLRQQSAELQWQGGKINLMGVDYQGGRRLSGEQHRMLHGMESLIRKDIPNILLSHNPNSFYRAAELGIELSLAGHTHGGQVRIELVDRQWSPARFVTKFVAGIYHLPFGNNADTAEYGANPPNSTAAALYVNRGLGTFGMPVRLGVPPEITLLTLRATA
ncbi:MAG: metallophosphoesterase [Thermodesulfovibrionales bacterium]